MSANTEQPVAPRLVVGAALVDDVDRPTCLLAARRIEPPALRGGYELPGGKVEPGEERHAALHREIREELGVEVVLGPQVPGPNPDGTWPLGERYVIAVYLARVIRGTPRPLEEHDDLQLLTLDRLYDVPWLPADLPVVDALAVIMRT